MKLNSLIDWKVTPEHDLYKRNGTFYFSRQVPSDLQTRFNKKRVVISLRTLSEPKALKSALKLADRLEIYLFDFFIIYQEN